MNSFPWLSVIIFTPWAGALVLVWLRRLGPTASRRLALAFSLSTLGLGLAALAAFHPADPAYQLVERHRWIPALNVEYHLGLDGMSLLLVLLTGLVAPAALLASWRQERAPWLYGLLFLALQGSALGVFLALNFFPWFIFWELSLVPAYFLIKIWGGPGAARAAYQFVIYTIGGSAFLLVGFAAIFAVTGTMDFPALAAGGALAARLGHPWATVAFLGIFLGLAVKVPLFPFHTWLPPAYAEAPTGVSMFLTGVMSKMGVYGFFRLLWPLFPAPLHAAAGTLAWLALGGAVVGALAALVQDDLKRMLAYSSVSHVSFCLLALFAVAAAGPGGGAVSAAAALNGAVLQMFNHGVTAAALFACAGMLEARGAGRRGLHDFGGLRAVAPVFAGLCGVAMFASLGLPGLNGFISEFLILRGVFGLAPGFAAGACLALLLSAVFLLSFYQRVFHGPAGAVARNSTDLSGRERLTLAPAVLVMFLVGLVPQLALGLINPLVTSWVAGGPHP
ncbi:MAG TPA: NADH-quinone oxidoreductase subunit M [Opitutaceae bacterium]|nr:NADH-quinone oxidoreductase subunit M [Opitutaceae bacterium]